MNYFKEAEKILSHRLHLQKALDNLLRREGRLLQSGAPAEINGIDTSKPYVSGGLINNTMQDCLDLVQIRKDTLATKEEISEIDNVLKQLSDDDCELLSLWYIDGLSKDEICSELHFSVRKTLYDKRNKAVGEFAVLYFGAGALYNIS